MDGNKRVGAASAVMFLKTNDLVFRIPEDELVDITLAVATHTASNDDVAAFFRRYIDK
ncbi:hypothetical protein K8I61_18640 [bacterium]|nr:hypothetical protein [bacterium]